MEKNTLLAIVLSFAVLFGYESLFVAPKRAQMLKEKQAVENTEDTKNQHNQPISTTVDPQNSLKSTTEQKKIDFKENTSTVNGMVFTNVGGTIHNFVFPFATHPMPINDILLFDGKSLNFENINKTADSIDYVARMDNVTVAKSFQIGQKSIKATIKVSNLTPNVVQSGNTITAFALNSPVMNGSDGLTRREATLDEYSVYSGDKVIRQSAASKFSVKNSKSFNGAIKWIAFRDHYDIVVIKPLFETKSVDVQYVTENKLVINANLNDVLLKSGETKEYNFAIYYGPQDQAALKAFGYDADKAFAFSNHAILDWPARAIHWMVPQIQKFVKSWGISIIIISLFVYGITYPLTFKSMTSMRKMQLVQPKILALKEKYKNDPQRLNTEVVEIYRREKINPLGGCLPFILQMPIFIALYQALWRSYYFQGKSFLWIKDLSQPDQLFLLPFNLPFLGNHFNILPIVMAGVMFVQQKLSSKNMVVTDETQAMQQKMMTFMMPIFIGFIFYKFASALSLYFTVFYTLSAFTQWKMNQNTTPNAVLK